MDLDRKLPPPLRSAFHGREKVRVKKSLTFEDGYVLREGSIGRAMHPGSQAATWVVYFPEARTRRVVPEWLLELVAKKGH